MERRKLAPGEVLLQASDQASNIYFLESDHLSVYLPLAFGHSVRVTSMAHGAIVGEISYLTGQPRSANVISEDWTHVLCLRESTLRRIEKKDPVLSALIMSILCRSLAAKLLQSNAQLAYAETTVTNSSPPWQNVTP